MKDDGVRDKLSVSLSREDVRPINDYLERHPALGSRSAVLHEAVTLLQLQGLSAEYDIAFAEWSSSDDAALWDRTAGDGIT